MRFSFIVSALILIPALGQSQPGETRNNVTQRALNTTLNSSQRTACISCHVTGQVIAAVGAAEKSGFAVNPGEANTLLSYAWSQQDGDGSVRHSGSDWPVEVTSWVSLALSYYDADTDLDLRDSNFQRMTDYLLSRQMEDGGLPENEHDSGVISLPTRSMPTMAGIRGWRWQFENTGEMRYLPAMARAADWLANYTPVDRTGDGGLIETCYALTGMAAAGRTSRDPRMAEMRDWVLDRQQNEQCWSKDPGGSCDAWATGTAAIALLDAGVPFGHPAIRGTVRWLLDENRADGWWPRPGYLGANETVSTNPVIFLSRIPVFYISHLSPEHGAHFQEDDGTVTISTDGISEEGREFDLTLYIDNVQVASSQDAAIEYQWRLEGVPEGLHYIRVEGRDSEGYEDSRESIVLVGDYVGLLTGLSPNPFNPGETQAIVEFEVVGNEPAHVLIDVHATRDDDLGVPRRAGRLCTAENAEQVCVSEGSTCEASEDEEVLRCSGDTVVRTLHNNEATPVGTHSVSWNGEDDQGNRLEDNVYLLSYSARRGEDESTDSVLVGVLSEAPAEVRGMVRDRDTDKGIPGSTVELRTPRGGLIQRGQVGRRGNYVLPLIRPGSYHLTAKVPGYANPDGIPLELAPAELRTVHFWMSGNQPPSFRPVDPVAPIAEGTIFELEIQAIDLDNDPISLEASVPLGGQFEDLGEGRGHFRWNVPYGDASEARLLVEASDGVGRSEVFIRLPIAEHNRPPVVHGTDQASLTFGQTINRRIWAEDPDGDQVSLQIEGMPLGLHEANFDGETFTWTAPRGWMGRIDMVVLATDDGEPPITTETAFVVAVGPPNGNPVLEPVQPIRIVAGEAFNHRFLADDPDGDALRFGAHNLPEGLVMHSDGLLAGQVPATLADSQQDITVWVRDSSIPEGRDSMQVTLLFVAAERTPYINLPPEIPVAPQTLFRHGVDFGGGEDLSLIVLMGPPGLALDPEGESLVWSVPAIIPDRSVLVLGLRGARQPVRAQTVLVKQDNDLPPVVSLPAEIEMVALQVVVDASESVDPEGAPLNFQWFPEPGAKLEDATPDGKARFRFEANKRYKIVLRVSDGRHTVTRDLQVMPEAGQDQGLPSGGCLDVSGGAGSGLVLLLILGLLRRRRAFASLAAFALIAGCNSSLPSFVEAQAPPPSTVLPGLISVSPPSPDGLVQIIGEPGAADPFAEVTAQPESGDPSTTTAEPNGSFETYVSAEDAEPIAISQSVEGRTSSTVELRAGVRPPSARAELARDIDDRLVLTMTSNSQASADELWIRDPYGTWTRFPEPDGAGRAVIPTDENLPPSPGDRYEMKQVISGVSSIPRSILVSEPTDENGISMTSSSDPEDSNLYISGPADPRRSLGFILVTNLDADGFPQRSSQAEEDGAFGPVVMPGRHGDRMKIEVIAETETDDDVLGPIDRRRTRTGFSESGAGYVAGSPGCAKPGAHLTVTIPRRGRVFTGIADETGSFRIELIVGAGETILVSQQMESENSSRHWTSPPVSLTAPAGSDAIATDLLRCSYGEGGAVVLSGLAGAASPGGDLSANHVPAGGSSSEDLVTAGHSIVADDGSFSLNLSGEQLQAGDEILLQIADGVPSVYLLPSPALDVEVEGGESGAISLSSAPGAREGQTTLSLAPGTLPSDQPFTVEAGRLGADGLSFEPRGYSHGGLGSGSGGRWLVRSGPDGGSGQRPLAARPGDAIRIIGGEADDPRIITAIVGIASDRIGLTSPDDEGRVDLYAPAGSAPVGGTVRAEVVNGVNGSILVDADGGFGLRIAASPGDMIRVYLDLPSCSCSSLPTGLVVPGGGANDGADRLADIPLHLLGTWRRIDGFTVYGAPMATVPGATVLLRTERGEVFQGRADARGSFQVRAAGSPGATVEITAQRGAARSETVFFCAPEVAHDSGLALTFCEDDWQLSGRSRLGDAGSTVTWTLFSMEPQRSIAAQLLLNGSPGLVTWRRRASETLVATLAPPVTELIHVEKEPLPLGRTAVIGTLGDQNLILIDRRTMPEGLGGGGELLFGQGLGAQRRWSNPQWLAGALAADVQLARVPEGEGRLLIRSFSGGVYNTLPTSLERAVSGSRPNFPTDGWTFDWDPGVDRLELWGEGVAEDDLFIVHYRSAERFHLYEPEMAPRPPVEEGGEPGPAEPRIRLAISSGWIDLQEPEPATLYVVRNGAASEGVTFWLDDDDSVPAALELGEGRSRFGDSPRDSDDDGIPDLADPDSDDDGIPDAVEFEPQGEEGIALDSDEDGRPDYLDDDSDGDGILDQLEGHGDQDQDGIPDHRDEDADNDGIPDSQERGPGGEPRDRDGDGLQDYRDTDSDGDGVSDRVEVGDEPAVPAQLGGSGPDYLNPCYPRMPIPMEVSSLSGLPGRIALPPGFDDDGRQALMANMPVLGDDDCSRPEAGGPTGNRPVGTRITSTSGMMAGAILRRHRPAHLDEEPGWRQAAAHLEDVASKLQQAGWTLEGPGPRAFHRDGQAAAILQVRATPPAVEEGQSNSLNSRLDAIVESILKDCSPPDEEGGEPNCNQPNPGQAQAPGLDTNSVELALSALDRCAGSVDFQVMLAVQDQGEDADRALGISVANSVATGSHYGPSGASLAPICDDFTYGQGPGALDVIVVVDNSGSMIEEQQALADAARDLTNTLAASGLNWRVGITTTDADPDIAGGDGQLVGGFTTSSDTIRSRIANIGIDGSGREYGLRAVRRSLERATEDEREANHPQRLRPGVPVAFILLTDSEDQAARDNRCDNRDGDRNGLADDNDCIEEAVASTIALLRGELDRVPVPDGLERVGSLFAITTSPIDGCPNRESYGWSQRAVALATGGSIGSICANDLNYSDLVSRMASQAADTVPSYNLGADLVAGSLNVTTGTEDNRTTQGMGTYRYDPTNGQVVLEAAALPGPGGQVGVSGLRWAR